MRRLEPELLCDGKAAETHKERSEKMKGEGGGSSPETVSKEYAGSLERASPAALFSRNAQGSVSRGLAAVWWLWAEWALEALLALRARAKWMQKTTLLCWQCPVLPPRFLPPLPAPLHMRSALKIGTRGN